MTVGRMHSGVKLIDILVPSALAREQHKESRTISATPCVWSWRQQCRQGRIYPITYGAGIGVPWSSMNVVYGSPTLSNRVSQMTVVPSLAFQPVCSV